MSHFRSVFRQISTNNSYQVSNYGPRNNQFFTFKPSDIVGLRTWLDMADSTVVTSSGGYIDAITNKGTASGSFRPNGSTARPYLSATSINGRDSAGFDGVNDILTSSISSFNAMGYGDPAVVGANQVTNFTFGVVLKPNRVNTSNTDPFSNDVVFAEGNASIGMNLGTSYGDNSRLWFDYGSTTSTNWVRSNVNQVVAGTTVCAVVRMLTQSYDLYINGTFVSGVVRTFNPTAVAGSFRIGNEIFPANGSAAKIDLCEFVIYSGTLSVSEVSQLSTYFTDKWGIV